MKEILEILRPYAERIFFDWDELPFHLIGGDEKYKKVSFLGSPKKALPSTVSSDDRIAYYKRDLVEFVKLNADQIDEFEGPDITRLQDETRVLTLTLVQFEHLFPDIAVMSYDQYKNISMMM